MTEEMKTIRFTAELKLPAKYVTDEKTGEPIEADSSARLFSWTLIDVVEDAVSSWIPNTYTALSIKEAEVKE